MTEEQILEAQSAIIKFIRFYSTDGPHVELILLGSLISLLNFKFKQLDEYNQMGDSVLLVDSTREQHERSILKILNALVEREKVVKKIIEWNKEMEETKIE